jgi:hypothetical protein
MGLKTFEVTMELHSLNRQKLVAMLKEDPSVNDNDVVYIVGGEQLTRNDTDHEPIFRQESVSTYVS